MERILGGVAVCGIVAVIALGARQELARPAAAGRGAAGAATLFPDRAPPAVDRPANTLPPTAAATAAAPTASAEPLEAAGGASAAAASPAEVRPAPAQADAQAVLRAAQVAYGRVRSLQADFVQVLRNPVLGSTTTSRGTLYERRPDRFLMRFSQPAGDKLVSDGRYFWVYYPDVDPKQVIRMPAAVGRGGVDLQAQFLGDAGRRFTPRLQGTETVGGRSTQVLRLVPRTAMPYKSLTVWLDVRDHLARRVEITEDNGSVRRVDLSNVRVNVPLSDAVFRFQPPAGAHVVDRG